MPNAANQAGHGQDDVAGKMHHSGGGWNEPDDAEDDRYGTNRSGIGIATESTLR